jgi:hypothetical protein
MGNLELQLVEPLTADHPISQFLDDRGEGLHHLCWQADDEIHQTMTQLEQFGLKAKANEPHAAPNHGSASFIEPQLTRGVLWELTSKANQKD